MSGAKIDPRELRHALGAFVTGVTVITTRDTDGTPRGFTANSFTSVSLDPPLVLVCLAKTAGSIEVFERADGYAVNILSEAQRDVSNTFAQDIPDRFERVKWSDGPAGHPVFAGTSAWLDCMMHERVDAGDHVVLIGRVEGFAAHTEQPLGYCRGAYVTFGLEQEAVAASGRETRIGAILEHNEAILMLDADESGIAQLPTAPRVGAADEPASLCGVLANIGLDVDPGFLFAVFEQQDTGHLNVFYRGVVEDLPDTLNGARFVPFDEIDVAALPSEADQSMLNRYISERTETQFGIYVGDEKKGRIHALADSEGTL